MILAPLRRLHGSHSISMLSQDHFPPHERGIMCPTVISSNGMNAPHMAQWPSSRPYSFLRADLLLAIQPRGAYR
jgi:hypothetical protein